MRFGTQLHTFTSPKDQTQVSANVSTQSKQSQIHQSFLTLRFPPMLQAYPLSKYHRRFQLLALMTWRPACLTIPQAKLSKVGYIYLASRWPISSLRGELCDWMLWIQARWDPEYMWRTVAIGSNCRAQAKRATWRIASDVVHRCTLRSFDRCFQLPGWVLGICYNQCHQECHTK